MKRFFSLLIALALAGAATACGGGGESAPSSSEQSQPVQGAPSSQAEPSVPAQPVPPASSGGGQESHGDTERGDEPGSRVLVACFSATGNTMGIGQLIQDVLSAGLYDADLYEIIPEAPYTSEDLDYGSDGCRANREQNDPSARPALSGTLEHPEDYDIVFLGYPIWWGQAPKVIYTFLESYDFGDAIIVPFCTSGSSGIGSSAENLQPLAPQADWRQGRRFSAGASRDEVSSWVWGLGIPLSSPGEEGGARIRLAFDGGEAVIALDDNAAARDFLSMLPAQLSFEDYGGREKISYLPRKLSTDGAPDSYDPQEGDVTLYAPWGNLAIFYRDAGSSPGLVPMGRVESGLDLLSGMEGSFQVSVSVLE